MLYKVGSDKNVGYMKEESLSQFFCPLAKTSLTG